VGVGVGGEVAGGGRRSIMLHGYVGHRKCARTSSDGLSACTIVIVKDTFLDIGFS